MKVLIFGGGNVGLGLASFLLSAGAEVDIIARTATANMIRKDGLFRKGIFGDVCFSANEAGVFEDAADCPGGYDYVLVCTKSYDTKSAAQELATCRSMLGESIFVLCQNGWGNAEVFCEHFDKSKVFNARVITGFERVSPNVVNVTVHADTVKMGSLFGFDEKLLLPLCDILTEGGLDSRLTAEIEKDLWAKMLYNCALNGLGAVLGVCYGKLAEHAGSRCIMDRIVCEIFSVMDACGFKTHWQNDADFLKVFYDQMVVSTASHRPSTLQDIEAGKRTEIEALNGAVIKLAGQKNMDVPANESVYNMVKFLENLRLKRR